jgi:hypothetical protein
MNRNAVGTFLWTESQDGLDGATLGFATDLNHSGNSERNLAKSKAIRDEGSGANESIP